MQAIAGEYLMLIDDFLGAKSTLAAFEKTYLSKFKNESREIDEQTFDILDTLFGDIDSFTTDASLLAENPDFYLNETQLREKIRLAAEELTAIASR